MLIQVIIIGSETNGIDFVHDEVHKMESDGFRFELSNNSVAQN
jgi:hypothetical protein